MNIRTDPFDTTTGRLVRTRLDSRTRLIAGIAGVLAVVAAAWYLTSGSGLFGKPERVKSAPPVKVATAELQNVTVTEHTIGTVIANATVQVTARVEGQLMSAAFKEGDMVKQGDLLFRLDPKPFQAALAQAQAQLAKDQEMLINAQND